MDRVVNRDALMVPFVWILAARAVLFVSVWKDTPETVAMMVGRESCYRCVCICMLVVGWGACV